MTDENGLTIRILREIQATQAEHTRTLADIKDKLALQDMRLQNHSAMFEEMVALMRRLWERFRDLAKRIDVLEGRE